MCDANDAGRTAGDRLAELLLAEHVDPVIVEPPAGLTAADGAPVVDLNAWAQLDPDWADTTSTGPSPPPTSTLARPSPDDRSRPAGRRRVEPRLDD